MNISGMKIALLIIVGTGVGFLIGAGSLDGTWCAEEESMIITFSGDDSLLVRGSDENEMNGVGTYQLGDSQFVALIESEDLQLEMGYTYRWKDSTVIAARPFYFTVNGDTVAHPDRWMEMHRCSPDSVSPRTDSIPSE